MCKRMLCVRKRRLVKYAFLLPLVIVVMTQLAQAQSQNPSQPSGVDGINAAATLLKDYFKAGVTLLYIIGAVVGLIGAIKVYNKWSSGDQDTSKAAASWFGACIFLVIVATALKSFFGISD